MTPMGEAGHERWKTGEYGITAAAPCPTTVAAVVGPQWQPKIDALHPEQTFERCQRGLERKEDICERGESGGSGLMEIERRAQEKVVTQ